MVKFGVIGVGYLGRHHTRILRDLSDVKLLGIFDINRKRGEKISREFSIPIYDSSDSLIEDADALVIATPTVTHYKIAKKALLMGKHTFVEKPITYDLKEADELVDLRKKMGVILQTGHVERFNPAFLAVKDMIKEPLFVEAHRLTPPNKRSNDVSVVLDLMVHDLDLVFLYIKEPIVYISAAGIPVVNDSIDLANVRLEFASGAIANITASRIYKGMMRKIRFYQRYAYISIDLFEKKAEVYTRKNENGIPEIIKKIINPANEEPLKLELRSFVDAILGRREPAITPEEATHTLKIAHTILEKIEERGIPGENR